MAEAVTVAVHLQDVDVVGEAVQPISVFQGIAQAVVETLALELGLADIVAPAQVGTTDLRVQGSQGPKPSPGLGRSLRFLTGPCQDEGVGGALRSSQDFSDAFRIRP